jgi:ankyrin repeat protein
MAPKKKGGKKAKTPAAEDDGEGGSKKAAPALLFAPTHEDTLKTATLMQTVCTGDAQTLTRLVVHYNFQESLLKTDLNGTTALMIACIKGDIPTLERLLSLQSAQATNIDAREIAAVGGYSALHHACKEGHLGIVERLLRFGANPDLQTCSAIGETPLQLCCKVGLAALPCARMLLSFGAKPNAVDKFGNTAAFWAQNTRHTEMLTELNLVNKPATAEQLMSAIMSRIPNFSMPNGAKGKKKGGGKKKKKKKD